MDVEQVIANLRNAKTGSASLDEQIAAALGEDLTSFQPPAYTTNLQQSVNLATRIDQDAVLALTWSKGKGSAQFEGDHVVEAKSPHLAICIASMTLLSRNLEL